MSTGNVKCLLTIYVIAEVSFMAYYATTFKRGIITLSAH